MAQYNLTPAHIVSKLHRQFCREHGVPIEYTASEMTYTSYRNPAIPGIDPQTAELHGILFSVVYVLRGVRYTMHHYEGPNRPERMRITWQRTG